MNKGNMFDGLFGESLINLDAADASWQSPFIKGEDLNHMDKDLADELYNYEFKAPKPQKEE